MNGPGGTAKSAASPSALSIVLAYYENPEMLAFQWNEIAGYPEKVKSEIEVVVVDDGSPVHPAAQVTRPAGLPAVSIFRIREDVPWNQDAARNIGAHEARSRLLLVTDIDHVVPRATVEGILDYEAEEGVFYGLGRVKYFGGQPSEPHPNSYLLTKKTYWNIGGHDEDFAGIYGKDFLFRKRAFAKAREENLPHLVLARVGSTAVADAGTRTIGRDNTLRKRVWGYVLEWLKKLRLWRGVQTLTYSYDRVV